MPKDKSTCNNGVTRFFMDNIPCEIMDYIREKASKNRRSITSEIILLIEKDMKENELE